MNIPQAIEIQGSEWPAWFSVAEPNTRKKILFAAFGEIHLNGYHAASIQNIIGQAGVTKGAFYHHFRSKYEMVVALIDEVYTPYVENTFVQPMQETDDPIAALLEIINNLRNQMSDEEIALGCPVDTLALGLTPSDRSIQQKIDALYKYKLKGLEAAFRRGQKAGKVRQDVSAKLISLMIVATLQGCMGLARSARSVETLTECGLGLVHCLERLRYQ